MSITARAMLPSLVLFCAVPAQAMNWEGHDDWMTEMEPAHLYEGAAPHAVPKQPRCRGVTREAQADQPHDNPYEQIPLARPACPESPSGPGVRR